MTGSCLRGAYTRIFAIHQGWQKDPSASTENTLPRFLLFQIGMISSPVSTLTFAWTGLLTKDEVALPEMLKKAGYLTAMVTNTPHIIQNSNKFDRGFDSCLRIRGQENDGYRTDPRQLTLPCKPEKLRSMETTLQHMRNNYWRRLEEDWMPAKTARTAIDWLQMNYSSPFFLCVDLSLSRLLRST